MGASYPAARRFGMGDRLMKIYFFDPHTVEQSFYDKFYKYKGMLQGGRNKRRKEEKEAKLQNLCIQGLHGMA